jgi:hypothetical protein
MANIAAMIAARFRQPVGSNPIRAMDRL